MPHEPIAVIGLACRLPGAADPAAFWDLLRRGGEAIREVPPDRWDADAFYDPDPDAPGRMNTRWGGFLDRPHWFDREFFKLGAWEASRMDPQQRLLLELAWEALEDAGQAADRLAGGPVGVFVGLTNFDYLREALRDPAGVDSYALAGGGLALAANRLSYHFDFCGPSVALDTACSSGLVAVHQACRSLRSGEADLALAGAVSLILAPEPLIAFTKMKVLSPDGKCRAFDAGANGFVFGEGGGVVVLKPLARALADGDPVRAVIRGSAVNHNGQGFKLLAPHGTAQQAVLRRAWGDAGVGAEQLRYVEANGTGSPLGDAIEAQALGAVLAGRPDRCRLGSVKTNLGNLGPVGGLAGLIKVVLALERRQIPASLHCRRPNPQVPWDRVPLEVQQETGPWPSGPGPLVAGVSAFGVGGTNAHVVLEESPSPVCSIPVSFPPEPPACSPHLLVLSAATPDALADRARSCRDWLATEEAARLPLGDICYTAAVRRAALRHRLAVSGDSHAEVVRQLGGVLPGLARRDPAEGARPPRVTLVFPGRLSSWQPLGRRLLAYPAFRKSLEESERCLRTFAAWSLLESLAGPDEAGDTGPVLVAVQVALAALWRSWGIVPDGVAADGLGALAAAHVRGCLDLGDALRQAAEDRPSHPSPPMPVSGTERSGLSLFLSPEARLEGPSGEDLRCPASAEIKESSPWLTTLGGLFVRGHPVDWARLHPRGRVVPLPSYPWQRQPFCLSTISSRNRISG
jgi:acyl transferase domain-containing protein